MMRRRDFLIGVLPLLLCATAPVAHSEQRLRDFARVVIADDALAVQKAAAEELAHYAGKITGGTLSIVPWSKFAAVKAGGLSFFVGEGAASKAMGGGTLVAWKTVEGLG